MNRSWYRGFFLICWTSTKNRSMCLLCLMTLRMYFGIVFRCVEVIWHAWMMLKPMRLELWFYVCCFTFLMMWFEWVIAAIWFILLNDATVMHNEWLYVFRSPYEDNVMITHDMNGLWCGWIWINDDRTIFWISG